MSEPAAWLLAIGLGSVVWIGVTVLDHYLQRRRTEIEKELDDRNAQRVHERRLEYQEQVARIQKSVHRFKHESQMKSLDRIEEINRVDGEDWKHG